MVRREVKIVPIYRKTKIKFGTKKSAEGVFPAIENVVVEQLGVMKKGKYGTTVEYFEKPKKLILCPACGTEMKDLNSLKKHYADKHLKEE